MSSYTIPTIVQESPRGDRATDIYSHLLGERIVFIGTPIDDGVANVIVAQLLHLVAQDPERDIHLYINSPGGSFSSMMAIYDTMQFIDADVATLCVGQAGSTAAILLAAGAPEKRGVLPHARVRLSQPHAEVSQGSISDLIVEAEELARVRREADTLLAEHTGRSPEEVRADTERALILRGDEAVDYGVVDEVMPAATRTPTRPGSGGEKHDGSGGTRPAHPDA